MNNSYRENYIQHHGIAGQKWGKQNGPPYPLDAGAHSASEKKANWKKSLKKQKKEEKKTIKQEIKKEKEEIKKEFKKQYEINKYKEKLQSKMDKKMIKRAKKHPGSVSNQAVRDALDRVKQEKELKHLTKSEIMKRIETNRNKEKKPGIIRQSINDAGKKVITSALTNAGEEIAGNLINKSFGKTVVETNSMKIAKANQDNFKSESDAIMKAINMKEKYGDNLYTDLVSERYNRQIYY